MNTKLKTASKLETINQLKQSIHNLKMRWPIGIKSIDDVCDKRIITLIDLLKTLENKY